MHSRNQKARPIAKRDKVSKVAKAGRTAQDDEMT